MGAPVFPRRAVEDVAVDLIMAAERLGKVRAEVACIATALEARWAANRTRDLLKSGNGDFPARR
jgi:hypothetical protein